MEFLKPRVMEFITPSGRNVLQFSRTSEREEMLRLSEYALDLVSNRCEIDSDEIIGKSLTVRMELPDGGERFFNGYVARFEQRGSEGKFLSFVILGAKLELQI